VGVKTCESLLRKAARSYSAGHVKETVLFKAATLYVKAKIKARNSRDRWKLKKRLGT
jgi:hypothetical protein